MPPKTMARKGTNRPEKGLKSIRQLARELNRSESTVLKWCDRGLPREVGAKKARQRWVAVNTVPTDELQARRTGAKRQGAWKAREEAEADVLQARIRILRHDFKLRLAGLVLRSAARKALRQRAAEITECFAEVPALLVALVEGKAAKETAAVNVGKQVENALKSLSYRGYDTEKGHGPPR